MKAKVIPFKKRSNIAHNLKAIAQKVYLMLDQPGIQSVSYMYFPELEEIKQDRECAEMATAWARMVHAYLAECDRHTCIMADPLAEAVYLAVCAPDKNSGGMVEYNFNPQYVQNNMIMLDNLTEAILAMNAPDFFSFKKLLIRFKLSIA